MFSLKSTKKWLIIILSLAFFLRFYKLGEVPFGVSLDEASIGYNAYSIYKTGKDEFGQKFPVSFRAFGEYKAPLIIYATVPLIGVFDLNEFSVRVPSAFFGFLTIYAIYLLVLSIYQNQRLAILSALILTVIPWHLQFTKIAYEGSLTVFLITVATLFFVKSFKKSKLIIISIVLFISSLYSHYAVRAFIPIFFITLIFIYFKKIISSRRNLFFAIILGSLLFLPLFSTILSQEGLLRASYISFTTDKGLIFSINEKRAEHNWNDIKLILPSQFLHNKATEYTKKFLENYISHFDLTFFLIKGDEDKLFTTPYSGIILFSFLPLLCIGLITLFRDKNPNKWIIIIWLLLGPVPSSLTRLSASSNRAFIMVIPLAITISLGLENLVNYISKSRKIKLFFPLILLLLVEYVFYLDHYYIHAKVKRAGDVRVGSKELVTKVSDLSKNYNDIWVTNKSNGYIHFLFYLKYSPENFQREAKRGPLDEYGFSTVTGFGKYTFDRIPKYFDFTKNILFVVKAGEEPKEIEPIYKVYNPDGLINYVVFDTGTVKTFCQKCSVLLKPEDINIYGDSTKVIEIKAE